MEILKIPEKHLTEENMNLLSQKKTVGFPVKGASGEDEGEVSLMKVVIHPCLDHPFFTGVAQRGDRKYFFKGMKLLNGCIILHLM